MTAVFGEFLRPARAHIAAACFGGDLPDAAKRGAIAELGRLVGTISRYLDDLAVPADFTASNVSPQQRAALDARIALHRAASSLHPAASAIQETTADYSHAAVAHLSSANGYLAAGRDLLRTHFTSGPAAAAAGNSPWAAVITSEPVTAALLSELAACSRQLATWTAQLSGTGSVNARLPAQGSVALQAASLWLRTAGTVIQTVQLTQPPPPAGRRLLAAMPPDIPPPRRPPAGEEPVPDLCDGITITAERLRHAVRAVAAQGRWSPAAISASWRRDALAAAITGHAGELILRTLAERARQLGTLPSLHAQLATSADALGLAWPAWRSIVRHWHTITTGIPQGRGIYPVAADLGDLVLRTGRLAYSNPRWTPACADASPARDPSDLAGTARDITDVLAAVHHAADAISRTADQDAQAVRQAAADHRLYMPTRLLPDHYDIPQPYTRVSPQLTGELHAAYDTVTTASLAATETLDQLAVILDAPSSILAAARISLSPARSPRRRLAHNSAPQQPRSAPLARDPQPQAGQTELILRSLQITEPAMLLRAAAIDDAARDLLANATASSRQRNTIAQPMPPGPEQVSAGPQEQPPRTSHTPPRQAKMPVSRPTRVSRRPGREQGTR
jgi:hypothetical protein